MREATIRRVSVISSFRIGRFKRGPGDWGLLKLSKFVILLLLMFPIHLGDGMDCVTALHAGVIGSSPTKKLFHSFIIPPPISVESVLADRFADVRKKVIAKGW